MNKIKTNKDTISSENVKQILGIVSVLEMELKSFHSLTEHFKKDVNFLYKDVNKSGEDFTSDFRFVNSYKRALLDRLDQMNKLIKISVKDIDDLLN